MSFQLATYNHETFDSLPTLYDAGESFQNANGHDAVEELGNIFRKYNQEFNFSLILLHRHFHQLPSELTVEVLSESKSISMPWKLLMNPIPDTVSQEYLKTTGVDLTKSIGEFVRPHSWKFLSDGTLSPYEFVSTNHHQVTIPKDFAAEIYEKLKFFNLDTVLGLHWNHRGIENLCLENSHDSLRANILELKQNFTEEETLGTMNVIWGFWDKSGKVVLACRCRSNLGKHTGFHY